MKTIFLFCLISCCCANSFAKDAFGNSNAFSQKDTSQLPDCIQKLNINGSKGIRSYSGGRQFSQLYKLPNGNTLYTFRSEASIGCNGNEPASTKYYNDSCKQVASFPNKFSIKQGFKPFIAAGYLPSDFRESKQGDYPLYFAAEEKKEIENKAAFKDPFPNEKSFKVVKLQETSMPFKAGDIIKIHTKSGLRHFRNNKLLNTYKIVPQLSVTKITAQCKVPPCFTTETKELVYFMGATQHFIKISNDLFFISGSKYEFANTPTKVIELKWKVACDLMAQ